MKKYLLLTLALLFCTSLFSCTFNFNEELIFGDPEIPTADIDKPTEEVTQIPTEEPTEKPTEPIITIDGITFDETLKTKLNAAKTYADVCNILGKEGTIVEHPEVVYYFNTVSKPTPMYPICVKFAYNGEGYFVSEDIKVTNEEMNINLSNRDPAILEQITIGKSFKEVQDITGHYGLFDHGNLLVYEWKFNEDIKISVEFGNDLSSSEDKMKILHMALWDYESTKTITEINRDKLKVGQTIAEINEMFGQEGKHLASGIGCLYTFEDGKSLRVVTYQEGYDPSLPIEENLKFSGIANIIDN